MNKIVVIGTDHHNTLGVIRGLGERGVNPDVLLVACDKISFVSQSRYINSLLFVSNVASIYKCLIEKYKNETEKPVIICCADAIESEIDQHYNILKEYFFLPGAEYQGRITELMNKHRMLDLACEVGLKIPETWYFDGNYESVTHISVPCIVKPLLSKDGAKEDIRIFKHQKQLQDFWENSQPKRVQIQELIDKDFEYQLIGCSTKKEVIIPGVSIILRPCKGSNTSFLHYTPLECGFCEIDKCVDFVKRTGYYGLFSLEFLRDKNGKDYFMEINFRNDGNAICTTAAGISLPYVWYLDCLGRDYTMETKTNIKSVYVMPDIAELKLLLTRQISILDFISDLCKTNRFMEYDRKDSKPFWHMIWSKMKLFKLIKQLGWKKKIK